jgi:pyruvate dehydrogenase phosphatase
MGTDGLWEKLTNEEVVGLVGRWLDKKNGAEQKTWFGRGGNELNVSEAPDIEGLKKPSRRTSKWVWQDGNVATHIIRNALGGGNDDEVRSIPTFWFRCADDSFVE